MALGELIKINKQKLLIDLALSTAWLALVFLHPFFGYGRIISGYDASMKAGILTLNFLVFLVFYYPMSCGLTYFYGLLAKKKKKSGRLDLAASVFFILVLNPVFVAFAANDLSYVNDSMNKPCGLEVIGFSGESAARDAGMSVGEFIVSADGYPVDTVDSLRHVLEGKRVGDYVTVETDKKEYVVAVQESQDMSEKVIGVVLKQAYCPK